MNNRLSRLPLINNVRSKQLLILYLNSLINISNTNYICSIDNNSEYKSSLST